MMRWDKYIKIYTNNKKERKQDLKWTSLELKRLLLKRQMMKDACEFQQLYEGFYTPVTTRYPMIN